MFWVAGHRFNNFLSVNLSKGRQNVKKKVIWELFQGPSQYIPRGIWKWFEGPYSLLEECHWRVAAGWSPAWPGSSASWPLGWRGCSSGWRREHSSCSGTLTVEMAQILSLRRARWHLGVLGHDGSHHSWGQACFLSWLPRSRLPNRPNMID